MTLSLADSAADQLDRVDAEIAAKLPGKRDLYYGGGWHKPAGGYVDTVNPGTGGNLGPCAEANAEDVDAATRAAHRAFQTWRATKPMARADVLRRIARVLRENAEELAFLDAVNCGSPVRAMIRDVGAAAAQLEFFAGLVTEIKGETQALEPNSFNITFREPRGVCARIVAYNHPLMFTAAKIAAPLAAGNTVIMKPPPQAPLSSYRLMALLDGVAPHGVINMLTGGVPCGEALVNHADIPMVTLIGSAPTGRAIATQAGKQLKSVLLELGGKNALIAYPDADSARVIAGAIKGMNFARCGQSCGSTSRLFVHESLQEQVVEGVLQGIQQYQPGIPTDHATSMGAMVSKAQFAKTMSYIDLGKKEGARIAAGGKAPDDALLTRGFYVEPTVFVDVKAGMQIARDEIFGPVLSVIKWSDEETLFDEVNAVEYGLTGAVFTASLATAHRAAQRIQSGTVWINNTADHFLGSPFGGYKQSGLGREECLDELLAFTQIKNVHVAL